MPHELRYDDDIDCVILRVEGTVTMELIRELAPQVARLCEETGCNRLLNDMSAASIRIPVMELFTSPKIMDESRVTQRIRRALVAPSSFAEAEFLQDVTRNRGHDFKVFRDVEEAKQWLLTRTER